ALLSTPDTPAVVQGASVASAGGTFLVMWDEDLPLYGQFSADGVSWEPRETLSTVSYGAALSPELEGDHLLCFPTGDTAVRTRPSTPTGTVSVLKTLPGPCTLDARAGHWGGVCDAGSDILGVVDGETTVLDNLFAWTGPLHAAAGPEGKLWVGYNGR